MTDGSPSPRGARAIGLSAWIVAAGYATYGLGAMLLLSPRVPYADPWRFLAQFLTNPFPANVLANENGHREVLPNALRVFELAQFAANQWLQIGVGVALALLVGLVGLHLTRSLPPPRRALAAATLAAGLFWLGNGRKLAHQSESVHLFLVLLLLLAGLQAIVRSEGGVPARRGWLAAGCGVLAAFSFGSGLAAFPAFAVVMVLQGATARQLAPIAIAAAATTAGLLVGSEREPLQLALLERIDLLLRWLGAGSVWALSPWLDPEHAARLPGSLLRALTSPVAEVLHDAWGPRLVARWPACACGLFGLGWLLFATLRAHRRPAGGLERIALGLAWFGVCVGALVVGLRVDYFRNHPDQVTTQRYVPWSMLLWTGLLLVAVLRARSPARAAWPVLAFVALLLPSTVWTTRIAWQQRLTAELTALGAAVGVLGKDFDLIETDEADLLRALPLLRAGGKAMFAWPEVAGLGQPLPAGLPTAALAEVTVRPVQNRLPGDGCEVVFHSTAAGGRLVLFGKDRTVIGLAMRMPFDPRWRGFVRGRVAANELGAAAWR